MSDSGQLTARVDAWAYLVARPPSGFLALAVRAPALNWITQGNVAMWFRG